MPGKITLGTAPDSWGVWFPSDPDQVAAEHASCDEVAEAGYECDRARARTATCPRTRRELQDQLDAARD